MNLLLQSFGEEKFGEWIDQAKNNDCEAHITVRRIVLCVTVKLKILVSFRVLCSSYSASVDGKLSK